MNTASTTRRRKQVLPIDIAAGLVLLGATAAAYALGVEPIQREHAKVAENQRLLSERTAELEALAVEVRETRVLLTKLEAESGSTITLQPPSAVNRRLALVADLAAEAGVQLDRVDPRPVVREKQYGRIAIGLAGTGGYAAFTRLVRQLHEACPDTAVRSFQLTGSVGSPEVPPRFSAELEWYTSLDEKTARPDERPAAGAAGAGSAG